MSGQILRHPGDDAIPSEVCLSTIFNCNDLQGLPASLSSCHSSQSVDFSAYKKGFTDHDNDDGASQVSTAIGSRASSWNNIQDSIPSSQQDPGSTKFSVTGSSFSMSRQSSTGSQSDKNQSVVDEGEGTITFVCQGLDEVDGVDQELSQQRGLTQQQLDDLCVDEPVASQARGFVPLIDQPCVPKTKQSDFDDLVQAAVKFRKGYSAYKAKAQNLWGSRQPKLRETMV